MKELAPYGIKSWKLGAYINRRQKKSITINNQQMKIRVLKLLSLNLVLIGILSCNRLTTNIFSINSNATVIFSFKNISDSLTLQLYNLPILSSSKFNKSIFVTDKTTERQFEIPCEYPSALYCNLGNSAFTAFLEPNDTLKLNVILNDNSIDTILFEGKTKILCDYYWLKQQTLKYWDLRIPLNMAPKNTKAIKQNTDTLMHNELEFLSNYLSCNMLPEWFINTEQSQIIYLCNSFKESQKALFERFLHLQFNPDKDYYTSLDTLEINNPKAIFSYWYFNFLKSHLVYKDIDVEKIKGDEWKVLTTQKGLSKAKEVLTGEVRDIFEYECLNSYLNWTKELDDYDELFTQHKNDFKDQYFVNDLIEKRNTLTESIVKERNDDYQVIAKYGLQKNDSIPYFYLSDVNGKFFSPKQFEGKLIYLNFWATWCKPCITSIPKKNELIQKYANNTKIVFLNICMSSEKENWETIIKEKKLGGINLYANENWSRILTQSYHISGLPTYFLIDNGKTIKPYCDSPDKIDDDINEIL